MICSSSATTTKRNSQYELEEVRSAERGRGHTHAHQGRSKMSRHSLGQTRTHVLVGREEDVRRFRQSRAALESAGQSCLTAPRRENCELTAQLGLRSTQAVDRAQTANTHRERPCASPTVSGGRHSRATCHFGFSRSKQTIQNVELASPVPSEWQADRVQIVRVIWVGRVRSGRLWMAWQ